MAIITLQVKLLIRAFGNIQGLLTLIQFRKYHLCNFSVFGKPIPVRHYLSCACTTASSLSLTGYGAVCNADIPFIFTFRTEPLGTVVAGVGVLTSWTVTIQALNPFLGDRRIMYYEAIPVSDNLSCTGNAAGAFTFLTVWIRATGDDFFPFITSNFRALRTIAFPPHALIASVHHTCWS